MKNLKLGTKLLIAFLLVGIVPFAVTGIISLTKADNSLTRQAFNQLEGVREIKKAQIERFFAERKGDMGVLVETAGTLRAEAANKLTAVREVKKQALEAYLQGVNNQILTFSEDRMIVDAMREFAAEFRTFRNENAIDQAELARMKTALAGYYQGDFSREYQNQNPGQSPDVENYLQQLDADSIALQYSYIQANTNPLGSKHLLDRAADHSRYSNLHQRVHPIIRNYLDKFGYYDIFLVDAETGDIVYSVFKELDFSTSLVDGPNARTNFGEAFRQANAAAAKDSLVMVDYAQYMPSYEAPAGFVASPIYDGDQKIGIAMFQFPIDKINQIMGQRQGLGETGETYLVGNDQLMRSDSFLDPEHHSVASSFRHPESGRVDTTTAKAALAGESGFDVILDYSGRPVLSSYTPLKIGDINWALLAEIDIAEAFVPKDAEGKSYYEKYVELYGYYDLFLINPDGYVFYTAAKEADYQTNLVNGKYSSSNLGQLFRHALESKAFQIADFTPYAPSNNEPAAFIAQPFVHQGDVELVVALQLSLAAINAIMTERSGMGETGETYLIGGDKLMRSDSFLDAKNHTVKASFADPKLGSVDTEGARAALAGQTDSKVIIDYNGNPVLSSYTPVKVDGINWALLAEIDVAEALAPVTAIQWMLGIVALVALGAIIAVSLLIARSISRPVVQGVNLAEEIARGDFSVRLNMQRGDEIGVLARSLDSMADSLARNAAVAAQIADGNLNVDVSLASEKDQLGLALQKMVDNLNAILGQVQEAGEQIASGSGQVSDTSQSLSQGATEQAASIEEISASLNQLSSQTTTNAKNANQANRLTSDAQHAAVQGSDRMQTMVAAMSEINDAGQSISKIIKTIDEIAFQTNLLALNAAVEAARAGQHGKGFAVVAEEVRNLAARSARAAKETAELIEGSVEKTTRGSTIARQTAEALQDIVNGIGKASDLVAEIAAASAEQAQGVNQINQGVSQIDDVTQQNTASAEECAAAAEELSGQAEQMRLMLRHFTLKTGGGKKYPQLKVVKPQSPQKIGSDQPKKPGKPGWPAGEFVLDDEEFGKY